MSDRGTASLAEARGTGVVTGKPFWLAVQPEPIYGVLHMPHDVAHPRLAVLILPTFGWDNDCSYRPRREWATRLASAGIAAARIDFPGTENSVGSPMAAGRVQSWVEATADAARWLREESGCERLVAIGIGLGGLVAYQAITHAAPIDDLILWGTRASGRAYLRELRTYATVGSGATADPPEPARADGSTGIAGHLMSEETAKDLSAMKIAEVPLPQANQRRVLLVGRDAHGVDSKLHDHLADSGAELTLLEADDYHHLTGLPELRLKPEKTISASIAWLQDPAAAELEPIVHPPALTVPCTTGSIEFEHEGAGVRERIIELETSAGRLVGITSEPTSGPRAPYCLVEINSGELRHTGPNRLLVEVARRAAALGVPTARIDLPGYGDSDGESVRTYDRTIAHDTDAVGVMCEIYDQLQQLGLANKFVPVGLCLGGYVALRAVLANDRSIGAISINPPTFRWTKVQQGTARRGLASIEPDVVSPSARRNWIPKPLRPAAATIERGARSLELYARRRLAHWTILWRFARRGGSVDAAQALDQLAGTGAQVLFLLSLDEPVKWLLEQPKLAAKLEKYPNIDVELLPTHDHILRPLSSQERALDRISSALHEFLPLAERLGAAQGLDH